MLNKELISQIHNQMLDSKNKCKELEGYIEELRPAVQKYGELTQELRDLNAFYIKLQEVLAYTEVPPVLPGSGVQILKKDATGNLSWVKGE